MGTPAGSGHFLIRTRAAGLPSGRDPVNSGCPAPFQALRIAVNEESKVLEQLLASLPRALRAGLYTAIADAPTRATPQEQIDNPRSKPAKLRWAIRA
jgi:16S rRNA (cytosine1402-N4)-methyltransferase